MEALYIIDTVSDTDSSELIQRLLDLGFKKASKAGRGRYLTINLNEGWYKLSQTKDGTLFTSFDVVNSLLEAEIKRPWFKRIFN